ncbi:hypothetical protein HYH03_002237 [Edaphochlamys debaryana]|uniref:EF-hand domain-containing protein n=1 Tax=Edaphochlamys debaryana TaxID=47281 RepID=A0A835YBM6_9CHLO|nr:hypothetical protein HYH03_002237 [Edaphochlamys debaryana]|eukprot:KAG2499952.1 hypothetical protein HYH03_002237 [Edaphochlamys debaryana]
MALARELSVRESKRNSKKALVVVPMPSLPKLAEHRSGSIQIKGLDVEARKILEKFDADGDGYVDTEELGIVVAELVKTKFKGRLYLWGLAAITFALVMILGCGFGLTWAVLMANKDTSVKNNIWVVRGTDDPLRAASSSYTVRNNVMVPRGGSATSRLAVSTATLTRRVPLGANVTTAELAALTRVHLKSSSGAEAGFVVTGFQEQAGQIYLNAMYGTVVVKQGQVVSSSGKLASILGDFTWNEVTGIITPSS